MDEATKRGERKEEKERKNKRKTARRRRYISTQTKLEKFDVI